MRLRPHRPTRELRRALTALGITLTIFAVPLWTVSVHAPAELLTAAPPPPRDRTAHFVMTAPEPQPDTNTNTNTDAEIAPQRESPAGPEPTVKPAPAPKPAAPAVTQSQTEIPKAEVSRAEVSQAEMSKAEPATRVPAVKPSDYSARLSSNKPKKPRKSKVNCRPDVPEITPGTGRQDYSVKRDLIDRYAKDLDAAADLAYVTWARDGDERVIGFKVVRIRCGSPLHEAGFQNGDIITRINGHKVRTVPQALAAYVALRVKRKLRVRGHREDGSEMDLRYRLT